MLADFREFLIPGTLHVNCKHKTCKNLRCVPRNECDICACNIHTLCLWYNIGYKQLHHGSRVWYCTVKLLGKLLGEPILNLRKLQHVQNFAARIISGKKKFDHLTPVLRELRWLTVTQQLFLRDAVFIFKCMTGCAPDYLRSKLVTRGQASGRVTRNSQQWNIPLFRTATGQRSFQYIAVNYGTA